VRDPVAGVPPPPSAFAGLAAAPAPFPSRPLAEAPADWDAALALAARVEPWYTRAWIEYQSAQGLNVNLDGEPIVSKRFRVEVRPRALPVRLGDGAFLLDDAKVGGAV